MRWGAPYFLQGSVHKCLYLVNQLSIGGGHQLTVVPALVKHVPALVGQLSIGLSVGSPGARWPPLPSSHPGILLRFGPHSSAWLFSVPALVPPLVLVRLRLTASRPCGSLVLPALAAGLPSGKVGASRSVPRLRPVARGAFGRGAMAVRVG